MTREDMKRCIKQFLDSNYASDNHNECAENLLSEYEQKIRADAIDKLVLKLEANMPSKLDAKERYGYTVALTIVMEQLKEQKK